MKKFTPLYFLTTFLLALTCQPLLAQIKVSGQVNNAETGAIGKGRGYSRSSSLGEWKEAPCSYAIQAQVAVQQ
jgi:hypothetical protein